MYYVCVRQVEAITQVILAFTFYTAVRYFHFAFQSIEVKCQHSRQK